MVGRWEFETKEPLRCHGRRRRILCRSAFGFALALGGFASGDAQAQWNLEFVPGVGPAESAGSSATDLRSRLGALPRVEPRRTAVSDAERRQAWLDLSSDDFQVRDAAQRTLIDAGTDSVPELVAALDRGDDPETHWRVRQALMTIAIEAEDPQTVRRVREGLCQARGPFRGELARLGAELGRFDDGLRSGRAVDRLQQLGASVVVSHGFDMGFQAPGQGLWLGPAGGQVVVFQAAEQVVIRQIQIDLDWQAQLPEIQVDGEAFEVPAMEAIDEPIDDRGEGERLAEILELMQEPLEAAQAIARPIDLPAIGLPEIDAPRFDESRIEAPVQAGAIVIDAPELPGADAAEIEPPMFGAIEAQAIEAQAIEAQAIEAQVGEVPADFFLPPGVPMAADLVPLGERFGDGAGADWIRRNGVESPERRLSSAIATTWGGSADPIARASVSDTRMIGDLDLLRAAPEAARSPAFVVDGFDRPWGAEMPLGEPDRFGPLVPFGPEPLREDQPFGLPVASNSLQQSLLRTVILDENWRGTPDDWKLLPQVDGLTSMQINGRELSAGELTELTRCLRLTDLSLNRCKIDPQVIDAFLKQRPDLSVSATGKGRLGIYGATEQDGRGCLIGEVLQESPAAAAGLMSGDRIEQIDGIPTADFTRLALIVAMKEPGETLELMVLRDGKRRMLDVTLEPRP